MPDRDTIRMFEDSYQTAADYWAARGASEPETLEQVERLVALCKDSTSAAERARLAGAMSAHAAALGRAALAALVTATPPPPAVVHAIVIEDETIECKGHAEALPAEGCAAMMVATRNVVREHAQGLRDGVTSTGTVEALQHAVAMIGKSWGLERVRALGMLEGIIQSRTKKALATRPASRSCVGR